MFVSSMLDRRKIAKKVSNWAPELQHFNLHRQWIRGEANILADAPSRAPEEMLARRLPIPTGPVMDIVRRMYGGFDDLDGEVSKVADKLGPWSPVDKAVETFAPA